MTGLQRCRARRRLAGAIAAWSLALCFHNAVPALAAEPEEFVPTRIGFSAVGGTSYNPGGLGLWLANGSLLFDYERVWRHPAPEPLRFKVEGNLGFATGEESGSIASANVLALYYLDALETPVLRPYVEAGIGAIYTDFRVEDQGQRVNFNPQAGIGTEFATGRGGTWFAAIRLHHVSNGGIDSDNRGINSLLFQVGRYFSDSRGR